MDGKDTVIHQRQWSRKESMIVINATTTKQHAQLRRILVELSHLHNYFLSLQWQRVLKCLLRKQAHFIRYISCPLSPHTQVFNPLFYRNILLSLSSFPTQRWFPVSLPACLCHGTLLSPSLPSVCHPYCFCDLPPQLCLWPQDLLALSCTSHSLQPLRSWAIPSCHAALCSEMSTPPESTPVSSTLTSKPQPWQQIWKFNITCSLLPNAHKMAVFLISAYFTMYFMLTYLNMIFIRR